MNIYYKDKGYYPYLDIFKLIPWAGLSVGALFIGGIILLIYYTSISYVPDVDIYSVTGILAACALMGIPTILLCAAIFAYPIIFLKDKNISNGVTELLFAVANFIGAALLLVKLNIVPVNFNLPIEYILILWVLSVFGFSLYDFKQAKNSNNIDFFSKFIPERILSSLMWLVSFGFFSVLFFIINKPSQNVLYNFFMVFLLYLCIIYLEWRVVVDGKFILAALISITCPIVVLAISDGSFQFTELVVNKIGLSVGGKNNPVTFIVKKDVCKALNFSNVKTLVGKEVTCKFDEEGRLGVLSGVVIRSKIGNEYLVEWPKFYAKEISRVRVVIRKDDVITYFYDRAIDG